MRRLFSSRFSHRWLCSWLAARATTDRALPRPRIRSVPGATVEASRDGGTGPLGTTTSSSGSSSSGSTSGGTITPPDPSDAAPGVDATERARIRRRAVRPRCSSSDASTRDPAGPRRRGRVSVSSRAGRHLGVREDERIDYSWREGAPSEVGRHHRRQPPAQRSSCSRAITTMRSRRASRGRAHGRALQAAGEAQNGITQFLGFDFGGGVLLAPPGRKVRKIELIGDSQPAAFGIEGTMGNGDDCDGPDWSAAGRTFGPSASTSPTKLNAELNGTIYSGRGSTRTSGIPISDDAAALPSGRPHRQQRHLGLRALHAVRRAHHDGR